MGTSVVALDATVVSVALPAIRGDLGGGLAGQQWISTAYLVALGSLILIGGSLGDVFGEHRIFSIGVAGFGLVSGLCAVAPSIESLIAARVLQGAFGALLTPSALAVIVAAFPVQERGAAIGSWTAWSSIATVLGPLVGGYLVTASWRLVFAINVPLAALTLLLVLRAVPARSPDAVRARVDWVGGALALLGLAGVLLALIRQPSVGWVGAEVWVSGLTGLLLLATFLAHERRTEHPMLPLQLFKRRNFAVGNAQTFVMYCGFGVVFFFLVLFLQQVAGYSALQAGFAMLPASLIMFAFSKRVGRLADRLGARPFIGLGPLIAAIGLVLVSRLQVPFDYATDLLPGWVLLSCGLTATFAPLTATVLAAQPLDACHGQRCACVAPVSATVGRK
jgi:EmrB/QacA subfamily drug resistance transporter